jgi:hypothetical protein
MEKFLERFLLVLPGTVFLIALAFDVGYFYSIGIGFFTFFSLSEHIVFAVQALPFAFAILGFTLVFALLSSLLFERHVEAAVGPNSAANSQVHSRKPQASRKRIRENIVVITTFALTLALFYFVKLYGLLVINFFIGSIAATIVFYVSRAGFEALHFIWSNRFVLYFILAVFLGALGALGFGFEFGSADKHRSSFNYLLTKKSGEVSKVRIVRSGDVGVLYFSSENLATFIRRDEVSLVQRLNE